MQVKQRNATEQGKAGMAGRVGGQEHKAEARGWESEGDKLSRRCVTKKTEAENLCEVTGMSGDRCTPASGLCITCRTGGGGSGGGGGGVGVVVVEILGVVVVCTLRRVMVSHSL